MTPSDKQQILSFKDAVPPSTRLKMKADDSGPGQTIKQFCDDLADMVPGVIVKKDNDLDAELPAILVQPNVLYHMAPSDRELAPLLRLIADPHAFADRIPDSAIENLDALKIPAFLTLFVTTNCPFCPDAVKLLLGLAAANPNVRLSIVDGGLFPETVDKMKVKSAPTLILDDQFRWTGSPDLDEVVRMMIKRDPAHLGPDALKGMLEDGNADMVAKMMLEHNRIFPSFIELLVHDKWPVRLGAMVAFETIAETGGQLAKTIAKPIWERFPEVDETVKGDILHVMGESGSPEFASEIKAVLESPFGEDVKEAAMEALEKIGK